MNTHYSWRTRGPGRCPDKRGEKWRGNKGIDQKEGASANEGEQAREIQKVSEFQLEGWGSDRDAGEDKSRGIQRGTRRNPPMQSLMVRPSGRGRWQEVWGWIDPIPLTGAENFLSLRKNSWRVKKSGEDREKVGKRVREQASEWKRERKISWKETQGGEQLGW